MVKEFRISAGRFAHFCDATDDVARTAIISEILTRRAEKKRGFDPYRALRDLAFWCQAHGIPFTELSKLLREKEPKRASYLVPAANCLAEFTAGRIVTFEKVKLWRRRFGGLTVNIAPHAKISINGDFHFTNLLCDVNTLGENRVGSLLNLLDHVQPHLFHHAAPGILDVRRQNLIIGCGLTDQALQEFANRFLFLLARIGPPQ